MILDACESIINAIRAAGIPATLDAREIKAPGCFVTVTKLKRDALVDGWQVSGDVLVIVRDLGGIGDLKQLSELVDDVIPILDDANLEIEGIDANQRATPPTGGTLPAARIRWSGIIHRKEA